MITVTYGSDICMLSQSSFFKLSYGVRPSFGRFIMGASAAGVAVAAGASATLTLHTTALYNIYPVRCEIGDAISPQVGYIYLADERVMWPYYYGAQDYNTYQLNRETSRGIDGDETDFELDNLNGADEWTFAEIFTDIFETTLGLAGANYTVSMQAVGGDAHTRKPRNIRGKNISAPETLLQLLEQANCYLAVDLLTNPPHYQVLPIGDEDTWQSTIIYRIGAITLKAGVRYRSLQNANENKDPASETDWWTVLIGHNLQEITISPKASRGADAEMLVPKPFFADDGFYNTEGDAASIGGTGKYFTPAPYAAFYESASNENSAFLGTIGDEITKEYKLSFQNSWYNMRCPGALPISLGRGCQEITWELTGQEGFTTRMRSFRPRELPFPYRSTFFVYDKYWVGGGAVSITWAEVTETLTHDSISEYTVKLINSSGATYGDDITIDRALGYKGHGLDGEDIRYFMPWYGVGARIPIVQHHDANLVEGSDNQTYICTVSHTADTDKEPVTGVDWEDYWALYSTESGRANVWVDEAVYTSAQKWFINLAAIFIGKPADRSLSIEEITTAEEAENRAMAVWK